MIHESPREWLHSSSPDLGSLAAPLLRTVIVEDEGPAREKLRILLERDDDVRVVAECENGADAVDILRQARPDLLLLDIQLPDMDGFTVLKSIPTTQLPLVIFTTAYDHYAIKAFEAHALDYLLKPFDHERLSDAVRRARLAVKTQTDRVLTERLLDILQGKNANGAQDRRLMVRAGGKVVFLAYDEIEWIEAAANYVRLHAGRESYTLRGSIGSMAEKLPRDQFVRIHRSTVVNARIIKELQPCNSGEFIVVLRNGKELSCSRGYRAGLKHLMESTPLL